MLSLYKGNIRKLNASVIKFLREMEIIRNEKISVPNEILKEVCRDKSFSCTIKLIRCNN